MSLSILDEKDMSTSFLSQTTYPDNDSLMDSLPPSLVNSVNSSYIISNSSKKDSLEPNIFSSATFTQLEQSERRLTNRPRCQLYNSFKRESSLKSSESYTKSKEEASQNETFKVLNENSDKKDSPKATNAMSDTITLHYSNKFRKNDKDDEKENLDATFQCNDAFYKDIGMQKATDLGKNSLNITFDKQELNEITQARQKLSLARKALPNDPERHITLPNQVESPTRTQNSEQNVTVVKPPMENAPELLSRRKMYENEDGKDTPKRSATFKKTSPKMNINVDPTEYKKEENNGFIDINSATLNLVDCSDTTLKQEVRGLIILLFLLLFSYGMCLFAPDVKQNGFQEYEP